MLRDESIRTHYLQAPQPLARPEIWVTVDYQFEYEKVLRIASNLVASRGMTFTTADTIEYLDHAPIVVFANGTLGLQCLHYLKEERGEKLVGLVVHPAQESSQRDEIMALSGLSKEDILSPDSLKESWAVEWIRERKPEIICSFWSSFIFTKPILEIPPRGVVNLHNSLLPLCRGSGANVWTILDKCPAGVSLHYIAEKVDQGGLIAQRPVPAYSWDTGKTLYLRLESALVDLFKDHWPAVRVGPVRSTPQIGKGSFHYHGEAYKLREIDLKRVYTGEELINLLRAFTFSPYEGCYFKDEAGNKVFLQLELHRGITTKKQDKGNKR